MSSNFLTAPYFSHKFKAVISVIVVLGLSAFLLMPTAQNANIQQGISKLNQMSAPQELVAEPETQTTSTEYVVKTGDTLSGIFAQFNLSYGTLQAVLSVDLDHLKLDMIKPGETLELVIDSQGDMQSLVYHLSLVEKAIYTREEEGGFSYEFKEEPSEWFDTLYTGEIKGSFSLSAYQLGLTSNQIAIVTQALSDKIDFKRSLKAGDRFDILIKQQYFGDRATGNSEIKAISFKLAKGEVSAFLAPDGRFYDRDGHSLERAFNLYPVDKAYRRITSSFNPNRKHPVTGRISPHNGTDFATPIGSPVYSTGDGKVIAVRNHPYAGKYLVIQHNSVYKTRYLHLSKMLVKKGQRIKRGQKIAMSGATGRVTGPHLHFEVLVRNRAVNAMKADLPIAVEIKSTQKSAFLARISEFNSLIEGNKSGT